MKQEKEYENKKEKKRGNGIRSNMMKRRKKSRRIRRNMMERIEKEEKKRDKETNKEQKRWSKLIIYNMITTAISLLLNKKILSNNTIYSSSYFIDILKVNSKILKQSSGGNKSNGVVGLLDEPFTVAFRI